MKRLSQLIIFSSLLLLPALSLAAGIQVSPSHLDIKLAKKSTSAEIVVANPTSDVQIFDVYADDFSDQIKANPSSFTLEAGSRKAVAINVAASGLQRDSTVTTFLSVVGSPLADSHIQARTGVKIPVSITVTTLPWYSSLPWWAWLAIGLAVIILAAIIYTIRQKKPVTAQVEA
jgi:P pilus assembly chaperone PapD